MKIFVQCKLLTCLDPCLCLWKPVLVEYKLTGIAKLYLLLRWKLLHPIIDLSDSEYLCKEL